MVTNLGSFAPTSIDQVDAVVFDLDGVIRHHDRLAQGRIEKYHRLPEGSLFRAAFGGPLGRRFVRGELDHDEFAMAIGQIVGSIQAATEFLALRAEIDSAIVDVVRQVRDRVPVALLTNGSRRTRVELAEAGLSDAFGHILNSAETGIPKPEPGAYLNVVAALGTTPAAIVFVDDYPPNVAGAIEVGMIGHHFVGVDPLIQFLRPLLSRAGDPST